MARLQRFDDDQMLFINDVLDEHGVYLKEILQKAIDDGRLYKSGDLSSSISTTVSKQGNNPSLNLSFETYGRFIEILYHRKSKNTRDLLIKNSKDIVGQMRYNSIMRSEAKKKKRKNTQWYSRNVYGSLNQLIGRLMYDYQDWVLLHEKEQIKLINKNIPI